MDWGNVSSIVPIQAKMGHGGIMTDKETTEKWGNCGVTVGGRQAKLRSEYSADVEGQLQFHISYWHACLQFQNTKLSLRKFTFPTLYYSWIRKEYSVSNQGCPDSVHRCTCASVNRALKMNCNFTKFSKKVR